jgi:hypothetical protein
VDTEIATAIGYVRLAINDLTMHRWTPNQADRILAAELFARLSPRREADADRVATATAQPSRMSLAEAANTIRQVRTDNSALRTSDTLERVLTQVDTALGSLERVDDPTSLDGKMAEVAAELLVDSLTALLDPAYFWQEPHAGNG